MNILSDELNVRRILIMASIDFKHTPYGDLAIMSMRGCEDISAKTKSVIELKKLQLLELQRRLRR